MNDLKELSKLIRYFILQSTTTAGSGHPTSSLSAADIMNVLWFGGYFRYDFKNPGNPLNDRLIFSKGHASPLFYSLYLAAGILSDAEMLSLRKFDSILEGHPTARFKYTEAATGSLGQGLSVGMGMALAIKSKIKNQPRVDQVQKSQPTANSQQPKVFVLLGDGEMAEGSVWEAANLSSYYQLDNLVAIIDVNRLGQSGETIAGWDTDYYRNRMISFGWDTAVIDGHDYGQITNVFEELKHQQGRGKPFAIIARTKKGKGINILEDQDNWHGKPLPKDKLEEALKDLGSVNLKIRGKVAVPFVSQGVQESEEGGSNQSMNSRIDVPYKTGESIATRKAYGDALAMLGSVNADIIALDGEVKNSTYAEIFKKAFPDRFYEMFIAEQNMVSAAAGFSRLGFIPFVSTFAAFLTRAYDQIRMAALAASDIRICGSHAGVSIGEDGPSQMGLEDLAMFSALYGSTVFYPSDAVSTVRLVEIMAGLKGISYLRTTRGATPVIYPANEKFRIGGSKVHRSKLLNSDKRILIAAAGITLFEAMKASEMLEKEKISVDILDCYSIKPIDAETLKREAKGARAVITVEDHWIHGGLGDMVLHALSEEYPCPVIKMAVTKMPRSGKPEELLGYEEIDAKSIFKKIMEVFK